MSDVEDTWPLPDHNAGKPKHLHAIGALSMNFNQYERGLYLLYKFHLSKKRLPRGIIELYYFSLSERLRLAAIQNVFEEFERSDKVKAVLDSNLKFFDWYSQVRNSILHAQHYPAALSADDDTLYLVKRRNKKTNASGYLRFTLPQLRAFADRFKEGSRHCAHFFIYLRHRNVPEAKWPPIIRQYGRQALPDILDTPKPLTQEELPFHPIQIPPSPTLRG